MLLEITLVAAVSVHTISTVELEQLYWDCDTAYMQKTLSGQDMNTCLSITSEFIERRFLNDMQTFWSYWAEQRVAQWRLRGYK